MTLKLPAFISGKKSQKLVGVTPSNNGVCVASVAFNNGKPAIKLCEYQAWNGEAQRSAVLQNLVKRHKLDKCQCATVMNIGDYNILSVEAPEVPANEMKAAIRWRVKDLIDYHVDDAIIDIFDAPASGASGRQNNIHVVVAHAGTVREKVDLLQDENVHLEVIDIPELALKNLAAQLPENDAGLVMIYLAEQTGVLVVVKQGTLYLARTLDMGYHQIKEADELLGDDPMAINFQLDKMVLEVQRSMDFYDRYFQQPPVSSILLTPIPVELPSLPTTLQDNLGIQTRYLDLNEAFPGSRHLEPAEQAHCVLSLGAALRQEITTL